MIYTYSKSFIEGVVIFDVHSFSDERGHIAKPFHKESYEKLAIYWPIQETLVTTNYNAGIIRGLHFQKPPYAQAKILYCIQGSFWSVVVDIRKSSPTYGQWDSFQMNNQKVLCIPEGMALGYCITSNNTTILYHLSNKYMPEYEGGLHYNTITNIPWPVDKPVLSEKDLSLPLWAQFQSPF